jgi:beta-barrel assembly-enhancing protease
MPESIAAAGTPGASLRKPRPAWPLRWGVWGLSLSLIAWPGTVPQAQTRAPAVEPHVHSHGLPSLGDVQGMSIAAERRLGDRIARDIYRDPDYLDDPVLGDYLQALWQPLLAAARTRGDVPPELYERLAWELMISRDRRVNAFALPGGYLGVHLGLIAVTDTSAELASVLAHELSHVSQRHIARLVARQSSLSPWMLGALVLGALAARSSPDVANAAIAGSQAVAAQTQLNFSRDMEREADRVGFGVMTGAGFDGQGFVGMFDKLQQASRFNDDGSFPYLRSHPLTSERMADMRARLPLQAAATPAAPAAIPRENPAAATAPGGLNLSLPAPGAAPSAPRVAPVPEGLHALMSARARVLTENAPDRLRSLLQGGQAANATPGERYAAAWAAQRLGQPERALGLATDLHKHVAPRLAWAVDLLQLELLLQQHAAVPAGGVAPAHTARLQRLGEQALASQQRSSVLLGAQAALAIGAPARAASVLQGWVVQHPRDALAWQTLARAYTVQGQTLRAIRAEAESRLAHFDHAGAVDRFKAAQRLPAAQRTGDPIELAIVDSRLRQAEALLREFALEE